MKSDHFYTPTFLSENLKKFNNTNIIIYQKVAKICVSGGDMGGGRTGECCAFANLLVWKNALKGGVVNLVE